VFEREESAVRFEEAKQFSVHLAPLRRFDMMENGADDDQIEGTVATVEEAATLGDEFGLVCSHPPSAGFVEHAGRDFGTEQGSGEVQTPQYS
jgi:hypothetical protein